MKIFTVLSWLFAIINFGSAQPTAGNKGPASSHGCALRVVDADAKKSVCVCNANYCDELNFEWPQEPGQAVLVESSEDGLRFNVRTLEGSNDHPGQRVSQTLDVIELSVDQSDVRQSILGFGGAFTDAAGYNMQSVPEALRRKILESYFGEHGSQYTFGRVVIGGADFSSRVYSYDDVPAGSDDFNLTHWSLATEDHKYKIPIIKEAVELVNRYNSSLNLFASSWSPPAFMKTSKSLVRGHLVNDDKVYESYAEYLVRFYESYKEEGISFWGGTVQNEPVAANSNSYNFNSLQMTVDETIRFVANYLGPALVAKGYTKETFKLMVNDDNIDALLEQAPMIMADRDVRKYVAGLAYHWYNSGRVPYQVLDECYDQVKDKIEFMMSTEACVEPRGQKVVDLGSWERAERYATDMIEGLNRHSSGWVDWNLVLDERGGPNWVQNFVDSPIIISDDKTEFYKQPMYYALAHFSRFFRPNSVVVDLHVKDSLMLVAGALKRDTNHFVLNILSKSPRETTLTIRWSYTYAMTFTIKPKSLSTFIGKY